MASNPVESAESVDIAAVRARLLKFKADTNASYGQLAKQMGVPEGTLQPFASDKYAGDNARVARQIAHWFAAEEQAEELRRTAPIEPPPFIKTRAATELTNLLHFARRGVMVAAATCPGFGKTSTLRQYASNVPNVTLATMAPSTAGVQTMLAAILEEMGEKELRGSPQMLSRRIRERVAGRSAVICIDEAQHLSEKALDELRGIHDVTSCGIALFGNAGLLEKLEGGARAISHAQLWGRIALRTARIEAYAEDGVALARAWGLADPQMLDWLGQLATKAGGLRQVSMVIQIALFLAAGDGVACNFSHLKDALAQLSSRPGAR
jgi:hypothetical protein